MPCDPQLGFLARQFECHFPTSPARGRHSHVIALGKHLLQRMIEGIDEAQGR